MGHHGGNFVRSVRRINQPLKDHNKSAGQGKGIDHVMIKHRNGHILAKVALAAQVCDQTLKDGAAFGCLADLKRVQAGFVKRLASLRFDHYIDQSGAFCNLTM